MDPQPSIKKTFMAPRQPNSLMIIKVQTALKTHGSHKTNDKSIFDLECSKEKIFLVLSFFFLSILSQLLRAGLGSSVGCMPDW